MRLKIAAIRSGTDPVGALPGGAFQRWLESPMSCPKCDVSYTLVVDWDQSNDRFFTEESRPHMAQLRKAIMMGHGNNHKVTHFETSGVMVREYVITETPRLRVN